MDETEESSPILDDRGRLFGKINVVDALVVVLVLGATVLGLAFVLSSSGSTDVEQRPTTNVTIEVGTVPSNVASVINEGDTYSPGERSSITVTDVYLGPAGGGTSVTVRARLRGVETAEGIRYHGAPPRLGRTLVMQTETYNVTGPIREVGDSDELSTERTTVLLQSTMSPEESLTLGPGQQLRINDRTVATIEEVVRYDRPESGGNQHLVFLQTELRTYQADGTVYFGDTVVRRRASIDISTTDTRITGTVYQSESSLSTTTTEVLVADTVSSVTATRIDEGDRYRVAGQTIGTVESISAYGTQNPNQKRVYVGLKLQTVPRNGIPQLGTVPAREGENIPFRTSDYEFTGEVHRVGSAVQRGTETTRNVTLQLQNVPPQFGNSITPGLTEAVGDDTIARVTSVERRNASVILTSQDGNIYERPHPSNQDVTLTAELQVRKTATGLQFKGEALQQGRSIYLSFDRLTVRATVVSGIR